MTGKIGNTLKWQAGPVLVTGHTGFKGTWLTLLLEELGVEVVGYSLPSKEDSLFKMIKREGRIKEKFADITNFTEITDFVDKSMIDNKLNDCKFKTFVHGDAKLVNFCFAKDGHVAGVDFQYVGGGCGMKDVAYFIGSCLNERDCEYLENQIFDTYFDYLQIAMKERNEELEV